MGKDERILLIVAGVALVAILVARFRSVIPVLGTSLAQTNLTINQPAFMFTPPVGNILPNNANVGGHANVGDVTADFMSSECGCSY